MSEHSTATGFDPTEPKVTWIALFAALSIITLIGAVLGIEYYVDRTKEAKTYDKVLAPEAQDLKAFRDKENAQLYSYGYIDRSKGTVRLPIDRAMELVAQEAASGNLSYPTKSYPVNKPQPQAPVANPNGGNAPVAPPAVGAAK